MLMGPRFDRTARAVVLGAIDDAARRRDPRVGTEHLLLGVLGVDAPARHVLVDLGVDPGAVHGVLDGIDRAALAAVGVDADSPAFGPPGPPGIGRPAGRHLSRPPLNGATRAALRRAVTVARAWGSHRVSAEHVLIATAGGDPADRAMTVLAALGVNTVDVRSRAGDSLRRHAAGRLGARCDGRRPGLRLFGLGTARRWRRRPAR